jgi:hypothetical protein
LTSSPPSLGAPELQRTRSQAGYAEFLRWKSLTISHLDQRISGIDKLFAIRESLSQPIRIMIDPN